MRDFFATIGLVGTVTFLGFVLVFEFYKAIDFFKEKAKQRKEKKTSK